MSTRQKLYETTQRFIAIQDTLLGLDSIGCENKKEDCSKILFLSQGGILNWIMYILTFNNQLINSCQHPVKLFIDIEYSLLQVQEVLSTQLYLEYMISKRLLDHIHLTNVKYPDNICFMKNFTIIGTMLIKLKGKVC